MSKSKIEHYRDLTVWQRTKTFAVGIYRITDVFPECEQYGLTGQIRETALSIQACIAAGHISGSRKVVSRHMDGALEAAAKLDTQLEIALELDYLRPDVHTVLIAELKEIMTMLRGLLKAALALNQN